MQLFVHRNEPNRPHISSDTRDFKERRDKTNWMRPNLPARPASSASVFLPQALQSVAVSATPSFPLASRLRLSAAGEGVSTVDAPNPQAVFSDDRHLFFVKPNNIAVSDAYAVDFFTCTVSEPTFDALVRVSRPRISGYPRAYPQAYLNPTLRHPIHMASHPGESAPHERGGPPDRPSETSRLSARGRLTFAAQQTQQA